MSKLVRMLALALVMALAAAACGNGGGGEGEGKATTTTAKVDYAALGLWDDGPCDTTKPPLKVGLITTFQSPIVSLGDQAKALEAAAKAFNARGGANGSCIEAHPCDDGANADKALNCVRELDRAGVVVTVNDQSTAAQAEQAAAFKEAGIPRFAGNVTNNDWGDDNAYPLDASGTGATFMMPAALISEGVKKIGIIRVDSAGAGALKGFISSVFEKQGATFPYDTPVPAGTTDYSQFILGAQNAGVDGVFLAIGEQEAVQVVRAAQQLNTRLLVSATFGTFPYSFVKGLGDFANNMVFVWSYPPATADVPVYKVLRADLAASGERGLQPENLKASPMRSWIGLYALLKILRDAKVTDFTRQNVAAAIKAAKDVPMLGLFGDATWTPDTSEPGVWKRLGLHRWQVWRWDPNASFNGSKGNFVPKATIDIAKTLCGTPLGAPPPC
jgi:ABC-type branched-subunit amino acid transport system substrate-binding protein